MNPKAPHEVAADGVSQALALLEADEIDREKLTLLLHGLQDTLNATAKYLKQASNRTHCGTDRPHSVGCAAQKVFDVPELLELILLNFNVVDLLRLQQVGRQVRDAVKTSKKVQQRMFLIPSGSTHRRVLPIFPLKEDYRSPVKDSLLTPILLDLKSQYLPASQGYKATMQLFARSIGLRYRRGFLQMQLTDPPIRRISVKCWCSCVRFALPFNVLLDRTPDVIIDETDGITLGRLLEAFKQVAEGHKTCPHAQPQYHDRYGNVILEYTAVGDLYMDRDDPLALRLRDREHKARNKTRKMEEYCHAKQYASVMKEKIPTWAEFEAGQTDMARRDGNNKP
ncbi:hypothetical protein NU195Hw_g6344t1 [Hortaea werneckii]